MVGSIIKRLLHKPWSMVLFGAIVLVIVGFGLALAVSQEFRAQIEETTGVSLPGLSASPTITVEGEVLDESGLGVGSAVRVIILTGTYRNRGYATHVENGGPGSYKIVISGTYVPQDSPKAAVWATTPAGANVCKTIEKLEPNKSYPVNLIFAPDVCTKCPQGCD